MESWRAGPDYKKDKYKLSTYTSFTTIPYSTLCERLALCSIRKGGAKIIYMSGWDWVKIQQ